MPRMSATLVPRSQRCPSGQWMVICTAGSSWRKASAAISMPAITHVDFATMIPCAFCSRSMIVSVVTSPQPKSSASARRTSSRYMPGSSGSNGAAFTRLAPPRIRAASRRPGPRNCNSRMCVAALKSRSAGRRPSNSADSRAFAMTAFVGFFSSDLTRRTSASALCRRFANDDRVCASAPPIGCHALRRSCWPGCAMHGARTPPGPDFLRHEWEKRREEPHECREGDEHRAVGRRRGLRAEVTIAPALHQLEIIVTEAPEKSLCVRSSARGVVVAPRSRSVDYVDETGQCRQHGPVERLGDRAARFRLHQREARRVQNLDREAPADLHLRRDRSGQTPGRRLVGRSRTSTARHRIRYSSSNADRRHDVALRLRHLLAIGVEHKSGERCVAPTAANRVRECERSTVVNSHVRMMSCPCGRRSIGKMRANRSGSSSHPPAICGVNDDVAHVSITSGRRRSRPACRAARPCSRQARRWRDRSAGAIPSGVIGRA